LVRRLAPTGVNGVDVVLGFSSLLLLLHSSTFDSVAWHIFWTHVVLGS
jgi:hypothetical protein